MQHLKILAILGLCSLIFVDSELRSYTTGSLGYTNKLSKPENRNSDLNDVIEYLLNKKDDLAVLNSEQKHLDGLALLPGTYSAVVVRSTNEKFILLSSIVEQLVGHSSKERGIDKPGQKGVNVQMQRGNADKYGNGDKYLKNKADYTPENTNKYQNQFQDYQDADYYKDNKYIENKYQEKPLYNTDSKDKKYIIAEEPKNIYYNTVPIKTVNSYILTHVLTTQTGRITSSTSIITKTSDDPQVPDGSIDTVTSDDPQVPDGSVETLTSDDPQVPDGSVETLTSDDPQPKYYPGKDLQTAANFKDFDAEVAKKFLEGNLRKRLHGKKYNVNLKTQATRTKAH
ncbi:hypothetical protein BB561_002958 [Smittium simulii]|uniref:Uncharacterized protein n=1 Tax=Smittium simulii TaxID=133385 RepID=A0A2T9YNF9_9FUNG|nr:hypothetical protein BB561_002958 [Smittium simulii]